MYASKSLEPIVSQEEKEMLKKKIEQYKTYSDLASSILTLAFALLRHYKLVITSSYQFIAEEDGSILISNESFVENLPDFLSRATLTELISIAEELMEVARDAIKYSY